MTEAKMRVEAMAGLAAPPFHPILTDAGAGPTFTMLGTTMRLIATAAGTGGRYHSDRAGHAAWLGSTASHPFQASYNS